MSASRLPVRLGAARGWAEFRHTLTDPPSVGYLVFMNATFLLVLFFQRGGRIGGTGVSVAALTLPSMLGLVVAMNGLLGVSSVLAVNREDGTLLRAKAIPGGMVGYLVARVVDSALGTALGLLIILVPGLLMVDGLLDGGAAALPGLVPLLVLGLLATVPWGAILGSIATSPQAAFGFSMLPTMCLVAISGIFYPITALPGWAQAIGQVFPFYWLGLGMRSAMLPDGAVAAELGESWRHLETFAVLGVWAVVGLLVAPTVLRRMARRESGSAVETRRQRAMQRVS